MSSPRFETFLARLYTDEKFKNEFLNSPRDKAKKEGLSESEIEEMIQIDRVGLDLAFKSYSIKRNHVLKK